MGARACNLDCRATWPPPFHRGHWRHGGNQWRRNNNTRKLDPEEFRGFVLSDRYAPLIFVNGADFKSAQMFTLAHELAHLWLGRDGVFDLQDLQPGNSDVERFCTQLLPRC
jgi:Zn-dependent peptidase ImmA (M78 family)